MSQLIHRRHFVRNIMVLATGLVIPRFVLARTWFGFRRKLSIFHTNDFHSRIEPFAATDPTYPNQGGISRIHALIQSKIKQNPHFLLLDSGDIMQGTPYFNIFGGTVEIDWMNRAGYHASTIGNHDFDNGIDALANWIKQAQFPFVNCNYTTHNTPLQGLLQPYIIRIVNKRKIGITGVGIDPQGLISPNLCSGIVYNNPVQAANSVAYKLKNEHKCHMVIVLSHLGLQYDTDKISDIKLAEQSSNIDLILGGHTHSFLDEPLIIKNTKNSPVIIHQVGWAGLKLGHLDFKI